MGKLYLYVAYPARLCFPGMGMAKSKSLRLGQGEADSRLFLGQGEADSRLFPLDVRSQPRVCLLTSPLAGVFSSLGSPLLSG